ncbi:ty1-copia retrotransposon protein [Cucumis melo var. makuwa]|uniref:Ty1-copia retrotransposon protein n=1 Tax=Cucumis melo var. makuwa TaxID=1194695 RepID=A0A5A7UDT5_CUCMM|nr:ty1-copia retrotransposon protein [Cucumis melo var. makuwa]TYK01901.1 ty1-copia retrotransposon protein [Cucumis melo var. makuwa]
MNVNASSSAYMIESVNLWHGRLGHVNFASVRKLKGLRLINTSESHETGKYLVCVESKFNKKPFKPVESRNIDLLELIHLDLADFKNTASKGGKNCYSSPQRLDKTSYELWKGHAPNLSYLKIWGCLAKVPFPALKKSTVGSNTFDYEDPKTYQEILNSVESSMWKEAIKSELDSLVMNQTWDLVDLPIGIRTPFDASKHFKKNKGDSVSQPEYAKIVGSVMYLMNYTRPDIAYAISRLSRYTHDLDRYHSDALRHLLRYLKGTISYCLHFNKFLAVLEGYCDANWVTDNDEVNSTSGYVFLLGGGAISWKSAKHTCIARSTMESKFIALELAGQEVEWIKSLLGDVPLWGTSVPVSIQCNSQVALRTAKNSVYNGKSRHICLRHVVVKQLLKEGTISLEFVRSEKNLVDPLTKGLTRKVVLDSSVNMGLKSFGDP